MRSFKQRLLSQSSRRWLATDKSVAKVNKKRQRPLKSLALPRSPETTRDRIRWLQDHNEVLKDNYYLSKSLDRRIDDIGNTGEERLNYLRDKIFGFWRNGGSFSEAATSPESTAAAAKAKNLRPVKKPLKMDAKWWFWNIAFALLPATLLTAYFELVAKPEMLEHNRIVHILKQRHLLGEANYNEEEDEELARLTEESSQTVTARIYNAIRELALYFYWGEVAVSDENENSPPITSPTLAIARQVSETAPTQKHSPAATVNPNSQKNDDITGEKATIAELKKQLQELEMRLNDKQQLQSDESDNNNAGSRQPAPSEPNVRSRIHNRVMQQRGGDEKSQEEEKAKTPWERVSQYLMGGEASSASSSSPQQESQLDEKNDQNQPTPINKSNQDKEGRHNAAESQANMKQPKKESETAGPFREYASADSPKNGDDDGTDSSLSDPNGNANNATSWWKHLWPKSG